MPAQLLQHRLDGVVALPAAKDGDVAGVDLEQSNKRFYKGNGMDNLFRDTLPVRKIENYFKGRRTLYPFGKSQIRLPILLYVHRDIFF